MRSPSYGANGMVATSQVLASQTGIEILQRGGSAVDAAIAANAMLSLTEPHMCGPGGDLFAIVWDPKTSQLHGLNASGRAPLELDLATLKNSLDGAVSIPGRGALSLSTPGAVDGWCTLHERFGRLELNETFAPVVKHATDGVPIGSRTAQYWALAAQGVIDDPRLKGLTESFQATYLGNGSAPVAGEIRNNPGLAQTYRLIGSQGRAGFYAGELAEQIVSCAKGAGGFLSAADLTATKADWVAPISSSYRGYDIFELPPNGQGMSVLQILNVLEDYPLDDPSFDRASYWHAFIEAKKLAFEDRARFYADPQTYAAPVEELISNDYASKRGALIDANKARGDFSHGDVTIRSGDTTYLTASDSDGMMVSLIQSIFAPFGSGLVPDGAGFGLQCRNAGFSLDADHPNAYAPGKRPFHTIIPGFVLRDGKPWMSFGVMGADMQPQGQVQVLVNMIDRGLDPQAAGDAPRLRHVGGSQPNGEKLDGLGIVQYEHGIDTNIVRELERRGHRCEPIDDWIEGFVGGYQAIQFDQERGVYIGATESRFDGCALGY